MCNKNNTITKYNKINIVENILESIFPYKDEKNNEFNYDDVKKQIQKHECLCVQNDKEFFGLLNLIKKCITIYEDSDFLKWCFHNIRLTTVYRNIYYFTIYATIVHKIPYSTTRKGFQDCMYVFFRHKPEFIETYIKNSKNNHDKMVGQTIIYDILLHTDYFFDTNRLKDKNNEIIQDDKTLLLWNIVRLDYIVLSSNKDNDWTPNLGCNYFDNLGFYNKHIYKSCIITLIMKLDEMNVSCFEKLFQHRPKEIIQDIYQSLCSIKRYRCDYILNIGRKMEVFRQYLLSI